MQISVKRKVHRDNVKRLIISACAGHMITILIIFVGAVFVWKGTIPETVSKELVIASMIVGAMVSGMAAAGKGSGIIQGLQGGVGYIIVGTIIGLYRTQTDYFDLDYVRFLVASAGGSAFGGIISTGKKNKKRNFRRK